jgi:NDP-sugar pyrophosphorylase family protein
MYAPLPPGDRTYAPLPPILILCGGLGTRLRAVVSDRPKPMAPVEGKPFLEHLVAYYRSRGATRFVLCAGYLGEQIEAHFRDDPDVSVIVEPRPLGTGGSVAAGAALLETGYFFVCNGDSFCAVDLEALAGLASRHRALGALSVVEVPDTGDYGTLVFDDEGRLRSFQEKPAAATGRVWVNAGVYCFSRELLPWLPAGGGSLEREVFPRLVETGRLYALPTGSRLLDIGTPERLAGAATELKRIWYNERKLT